MWPVSPAAALPLFLGCFHQYLNSRFDTVSLGAAVPHKGCDKNRTQLFTSPRTLLAPTAQPVAAVALSDLSFYSFISFHKRTFYNVLPVNLFDFGRIQDTLMSQKRSQNIPTFIREVCRQGEQVTCSPP